MTKKKTPLEKFKSAACKAVDTFSADGGDAAEAPSVVAMSVNPFAEDGPDIGGAACISPIARTMLAVHLLAEGAGDSIGSFVLHYIVETGSKAGRVDFGHLMGLLHKLATRDVSPAVDVLAAFASSVGPELAEVLAGAGVRFTEDGECDCPRCRAKREMSGPDTSDPNTQ